ncbi:MAG: DUF2029 domain-containing protein [Sphingobacteriaceae bacterium]|nr:DUF2029 domain-containing protein [Sphingobacteriaceae bacterium]
MNLLQSINANSKKWIYILGGLGVMALVLFEARGEGDFNIFLNASKDLLTGKNIYTETYYKWYHYYYDLSFALFLYPFSYFPFYIVKVLWLFANVFFTFRIWKIIQYYLSFEKSGLNNKLLFSLLSFAFALPFLRDNFHLAQVTTFILYLCFEGIFFLEKNKTLKGSLLIALGISIKLLPLILIPYLIYRGNFKAIAYILLWFIVLAIFPAIFIGIDQTIFLLHQRWILLNPGNTEHILDTAERSFHSLSTLFATLFIKDCGDIYALKIPRNIADVSIENLKILINTARVVLILLSLYFFKTRPFHKSKSNLNKLYELSYLFLLIPLIFPHQQFYAFLFTTPACIYLLYYFFRKYNSDNIKQANSFRRRKITLIILLIIIFSLTGSHFYLGQFNDYYDHFKTLTYGALLIIPVLAFCSPEKLNEQTRLIEKN